MRVGGPPPPLGWGIGAASPNLFVVVVVVGYRKSFRHSDRVCKEEDRGEVGGTQKRLGLGLGLVLGFTSNIMLLKGIGLGSEARHNVLHHVIERDRVRERAQHNVLHPFKKMLKAI